MRVIISITTLSLVILLLPRSSALASSSPAEKRWTLRTDVCLGAMGVNMDSDWEEPKTFPVLLGQVKIGLNTEYVSFEYGIGGPVFAQSAGVRARYRPGNSGGLWLYLRGDYVFILGGLNVAQFVALDLGFEYISSGGFSLLFGVGPFGVIKWFNYDGTSGFGILARIGVGYSF